MSLSGPAGQSAHMRGQTTLDFAIGISIFLAVVLFTFAFLPSVLDPFDVVAEENPTLADRTADDLAHGQLGSPEEPNILDRFCTVAFFETGPPPGECRYDGETLEERLGLGLGQNANVTLFQSEQRLCWTDDAGDAEPGLVESDSADCDPSSGDTVLAVGDQRPGSTDTSITSRRVVTLYGETVVIEVMLW
jgi:hypothetical protein